MDSPAAAVAITFVGAALALGQALRFRPAEMNVLLASYAFHILAAIAQVWLTLQLYGGGDLFGYTLWGRQIAASLDVHFDASFPEVIRLIFQQDAVLPIDITHPDSSTGTMVALAGLIAFVTRGDAYGLCIACGIAAHFGMVALYTVFREGLPERLHVRALAAITLMPSVVFWSSALLKESLAMTGLGLVTFGAHRVAGRHVVTGLPALLAGTLLVALLKPYILFAFVLAAGAWIYWRAATRNGNFVLRPGLLIVGAAVGFGGVLLLGMVFPQYAIDNVAEEAATLQGIGQEVRGGSSYDFGSADARTLSGQIVFAPLALVSALFRPFIFEARAPQILVNALETSLLAILAGTIFMSRSTGSLVRRLREYPMLVFCVVFVLVFGTAVGLGSTNLGTLSRYRMPLVPFFALLLVVLADPETSTATASSRGARGYRTGARDPSQH